MDRRDEDDRRESQRREGEDRRKIARFSHPPIRGAFQQITVHSYILMGIAFCLGVYQLFRGFRAGSPEEITYAIFAGAIMFVLTALLLRYTSSVKDYLKNESVGNIERTIERQNTLFLMITFLVIFALIVHFVFM